MPSLVGSIVERKVGSTSSAPNVKISGKNGFPAVQHRSKSAFSRSRDEQTKTGSTPSRQSKPPAVQPAIQTIGADDEDGTRSETIAQASDDWRRQMEEENSNRIDSMSPEEVEAARQSILDQFGPEIGKILEQSRKAREIAKTEGEDPLFGRSTRPKRPSVDVKTLKSAMASRATSPTPPSAGSPRPSSRADRQIRFAGLRTKDVHVYESAPPSPRRQALALPPPGENDRTVTSLGEFKGKLDYSQEPVDLAMKSPEPEATSSTSRTSTEDTGAEEGTPEDIRRRFFPNTAPHDPALEWIEGPAETSASSSTSLRFDLTGTPISPALSATLPTHLGLHHHAEGTHAGYTLDDIFLLSRSTVPAQRASMLGIMSGIAIKLAKGAITELREQEKALRKRMLAAGLELLGERGSLGVRAVHLVWVCITASDEHLSGLEGVELKNTSDDTIDSLPVHQILQQISVCFETAALPPESLSQLLAVLHRLAQHSNEYASAIVETPKLLTSVLQQFLLRPPSAEDTYPDPLALQLLITLTLASRDNAKAISDCAAPLLRFVVMLPDATLYPQPLAIALLTSTLRLYGALGTYGLCAHLATTASEHVHQLRQYITSGAHRSEALLRAWLNLIEVWLVCARDPHRTTPDHDILWSQIASWEWGIDLLQFHRNLHASDPKVWSALWRAEAAWLEGTSVNSMRNGETEKRAALAVFRPGFEQGFARQIVDAAAQELGAILNTAQPEDVARPETWIALSQHAETLASATRLWLSCRVSQPSSTPVELSFSLPTAQISTLCAQLTTHPLWTMAYSDKVPIHARIATRSLSTMLSAYLNLSRSSSEVPPELWIAQAFCILDRLSSGDEEAAVNILNATLGAITPTFVEGHNLQVPPVIWEKRGFADVIPLLTHSLRQNALRIGPVWPTPQSIFESTTQRLPAASEARDRALPLPKDWMFIPVDHLLRSGTSDVFKSLPSSWDLSEADIVRASLLLAKIHRQVLLAYGLHTFVLDREETVFACMKVFMLEHEQQQESSTEEVFRDSIVARFMEDLLAPFTVAAASSPNYPPPLLGANASLEDVAKPFLGEHTPFYQYYTDFVALYDAVSFSYPLFARLLLPPLSMRYPVDFRKYLWADYGHVIRTIRTPVDSVIASSIGEFLWPVEDNPEIISAYLRSLAKGHAAGFLRLVAVHHVACNIWPDLRGDDVKSIKLLEAVVSQLGFDGVKEIVSYRPSRDASVYPPVCFEDFDKVRTSRSQFAERCSKEVQLRIGKLFES